VKALSIRQPWAWLIVNGYKDIENRTWQTKYRGEFLVHASKTFDMKALGLLTMKRPDIVWPETIEDFGLGGIIGGVTLVDCVEKSDSKWFEGPYGFVLENPKKFEVIPYRGNLNFFNVDESVFATTGTLKPKVV